MLRARMATAKGDAGSILFFPSYWRVQSSLLRVDHVAERLAERGWRTAIARPDFDLARRRRLLEAMSPDVLFIHLARNEHHDPALYPGRRVVFDMDDADWLNPRFAERVEACVAGAAGVIAGSRHLRRWCDEHGAKRSTVVWTGTPPSEGPRPAHEDRAPIVTWAQSDPANYPEELAFVEDVMTRVAARRPGVRLRLYGWRERYEASLTAGMERAGVAVEKVAPLPYADFLRSLRETAVGLSPVIEANPYSRGKSFGKILAYFDAEVPVVTSDAVDHPLLFTHENGVMSDDPAVWAAEIEALLVDPTRRAAMGRAGFETMRARLSSDAAATRVEAFLKEVIAATP
ncbi:MAG: glycosyltransferase [Pseudomonadota bacterium]